MNLFKKKTPEEKQERRAKELLTLLLSDTDYSLTDLETVQVMNNFRGLYANHLQNRRSEHLSKSTEHSQKAKELENVMQFIE